MPAVTLQEVKAFLQIDHDAEDDLIYSLIDAAVMHIEAETGLALTVQTGPYEPHKLDSPKPLQPFTVTDGTYTTSVTDKLPALRPAIYLYIQSLYETDPKTIELALDASRRLARLHRVNWGF